MPATIAGLTLAEWKCEVEKLTTARDAILRSQDYTVSDGVVQRRNRRVEYEQLSADLKAARNNVEQLVQQTTGGRRIYQIAPR